MSQVNSMPSAPNNGDGGFIDTSAAHLKIADTAKITTHANSGKNGSWIIDPFDFTIAAVGGDITGTALSAALNLNSVTIQTNLLSATCLPAVCGAGNAAGNGDIFVNDVVTWAANTLTLTALRDININAPLNASGTGSLTLNAVGTITAPSAVSVNGIFTLEADTWNQVNASLPSFFATDFRINTASTFIRALSGTGSAASPYQLADVYGLQGMGSVGMLGNYYTLGADIDASSTSGWNTGRGFVPVGDNPSLVSFTGNFDGLGHSISGLTINLSTTVGVGLFGYVLGGGVISNVGMLGGSIVGQNVVGGLVAENGGIINNSYATGSVNGITLVGGLVGWNFGTINNAYATGNVRGNTEVGGLVGDNSGTISNAYATGSVTGFSTPFIPPVTPPSLAFNTGGLVGLNSGTISNAYATGSVTGDTNVGGLVGAASAGFFSSISNAYATGRVIGNTRVGGLVGTSGIVITNSFWNIETTGQTISAGGTGKTTAEMQQLATFANAGWSIANTGGSSAIWRIYKGNTSPLLRSFLSPLTVAANNITKTYNGLSDSILSNPIYSVAPSANLLGTATPYGTAKNVGSYTATGLYSNQQGYDISLINGALTITPATLTYTANAASRFYGDTNSIFSGTVTGFVNGELQANVTTGTASYDSLATNASNVGNYLITGSGLTANNGNYNFVQATSNSTALSIIPATLTYTANAASRLYGAANPAFSGTVTGFVNGETLATATTGLLGFSSLANNLTNVGSYAIDGSGLIANFGNYS